MKKTISFLLALLLLIPVAGAFADDSASLKEDGFSTSYTYNYDYWGDVQMSPDPYRVETIIDSMTLGLENLEGKLITKPQSIFIRNNDVYLADSGNNRILQIRYKDGEATLTRVISEIAGTEPTGFNYPTDVFADEDNNIYIADQNNNRVVMVDKDLNFIREFVKPDDATFNQASAFLPSKIAVDVAGRVYVLAVNVNKGFMKYENDATFTGYIGANAVKVNMADYGSDTSCPRSSGRRARALFRRNTRTCTWTRRASYTLQPRCSRNMSSFPTPPSRSAA